jgi:hypothetical protein
LYLQAHDQCASHYKGNSIDCNSGSFKNTQGQLSGENMQNNDLHSVKACNQGEGIKKQSVRAGLSVQFEGKSSFVNNVISWMV